MGRIVVVGAGIGGLTLALELHRVGIAAQVLEAADEFGEVGVGINVLPHASRLLGELGLESALTSAAVLTRESVFFNRFGQLIHREPAGRAAGYADPQYSIHRADLHAVLLNAVRDRVGSDAVQAGARVTGVTGEADRVIVHVADHEPVPAAVVVACDGIRSVIRHQFYPDEGPPRYSGVNMWRGVAFAPPVLTGASMIRIGWLATGKLVVYPIRDNVDGRGNQLINWVAELETPENVGRDWNRPGRLADFAEHFAEWHFEWLDVPALLAATEAVLEYPMVDHDPLPRWSFGRITLLGDAAHPMVPRGSNGAGQAILDARCLAERLAEQLHDPVAALQAYEHQRREATARIVLTNRTNPPDALLREIYLRTNDQPFANIDDVLSPAEIADIGDRYRDVAGYSRSALPDGS